MLNNLIINVSLLISLIFIYITTRRKLRQSRPTALILYLYDGLSGGVMGYILMHYSIVIEEGTIIDFRYIPIILIFLFINDKAAIMSAGLIAGTRFMISISLSSFISILVLLVLVVGLYVIKYLTRKSESIYLKGTMMVVYATFLYTLFFIYRSSMSAEFIWLLVFFWIVSLAGGPVFTIYHELFKNSRIITRKI